MTTERTKRQLAKRLGVAIEDVEGLPEPGIDTGMFVRELLAGHGTPASATAYDLWFESLERREGELRGFARTWGDDYVAERDGLGRLFC